MPSFDIVSEVDAHELANALDQARRELSQRFDLKGTGARIDAEGSDIAIVAESEFQARQVLDILRERIAKRGIDVDCLVVGEVHANVAETTLPVTVREGIDKDLGRRLVKLVKASRLKVQAQIQQEQVRVSGKKRDDLQQVMAAVKAAELDYPMQFRNFRD